VPQCVRRSLQAGPAVFAHFEAIAPALEAVAAIPIRSASATVTIFLSPVTVPVQLMMIFPGLVGSELKHVGSFE
jgi:hypothetical protein